MTTPTIEAPPKNTGHLSITVDREALAAAAAAGKREISGLAVPYGVQIDRPDYWYGTSRLEFAADSAVVRDDAKLFFGHDHVALGTPIGRITSWENTPEGLRITATLSATLKADEIYALLQDGTLDKFSIGFYYVTFSIEEEGALLLHTEIDVFETSVVSYPAYDGAAVENVLSSDPTTRKGPQPMTAAPTAQERQEAQQGAESLAQVAESQDLLAASISEIERKLATIGDAVAPSTPAALFSSYGEYVKAMLSGDDNARSMALAFEEGDGVAADSVVRDPWVGDIINLIEKARKVYSLFDSAPLPAEGTTLEYGKIVDNTIDVERQLAEGDDLVKGNIKIGTANAPVLTFGGASEMSLQKAIRSSVPILDLTWRALAIAYGKTTEQYVRTVKAAAAAQTVGSLAALDTVEGWIEFLVASAMHLDDKGLTPEYLEVSPDMFTGLATLRLGTDGPFLLDRSSGSINLTELTGNVAGIKTVLTPGTGKVEVGNSFALKTFESGGAPLRLGPETEILNLTQAIGVYGFLAVAVQDAKALVRPGA